MRFLNYKDNLGSCLYKVALLIIFTFKLIPLPGQASLQDSIASEKSEYLIKMLNHDKKNAQIWWYGWLGGYSAATVVQGIVFFSNDNKSTRQDMALGAATTALGAIGQILTPIVPHHFSLTDSQVPGNSSAGQSKEILFYEEFLKEIAAREKKGRSWKMHAITGAVNLSTGLITWLGFKRSVWDGIEIFALNTAVTELQIWTQPTRAIKDYKNYQDKWGSVSGLEPSKPEKEWYVMVYPGGIKVELNF